MSGLCGKQFVSSGLCRSCISIIYCWIRSDRLWIAWNNFNALCLWCMHAKWAIARRERKNVTKRVYGWSDLLHVRIAYRKSKIRNFSLTIKCRLSNNDNLLCGDSVGLRLGAKWLKLGWYEVKAGYFLQVDQSRLKDVWGGRYFMMQWKWLQVVSATLLEIVDSFCCAFRDNKLLPP